MELQKLHNNKTLKWNYSCYIMNEIKFYPQT